MSQPFNYEASVNRSKRGPTEAGIRRMIRQIDEVVVPGTEDAMKVKEAYEKSQENK
jgi:hypothetical protein